jgi:hypothetical protein
VGATGRPKGRRMTVVTTDIDHDEGRTLLDDRWAHEVIR